MPVLPIGPSRPPYRRRTLMRRGTEAGWWTYESENPPEHLGPDGQPYGVVTYTVRIGDGRRVVLTVGEVDGFLELDSDAAVVAAFQMICECAG